MHLITELKDGFAVHAVENYYGTYDLIPTLNGGPVHNIVHLVVRVPDLTSITESDKLKSEQIAKAVAKEHATLNPKEIETVEEAN